MGLNHKGKVLKLLFSLCSYLLIAGFAWSQEVGAFENETVGRTAESQILIAQDVVENTENSITETSSYGIWFFVRTILVLAVVLGLVWAFFLFLKKVSGTTTSSDPYLKKVASLSLSPGKFVYVITLNSKAYLIGVADNSVNLISEIDDKELIDAMNLHAPQNLEGKKPLDFNSLLGKFVNTNGQKHSAKKLGGSFSSSNVVELLQNQRSRLNATEMTEEEDVTP